MSVIIRLFVTHFSISFTPSWPNNMFISSVHSIRNKDYYYVYNTHFHNVIIAFWIRMFTLVRFFFTFSISFRWMETFSSFSFCESSLLHIPLFYTLARIKLHSMVMPYMMLNLCVEQLLFRRDLFFSFFSNFYSFQNHFHLRFVSGPTYVPPYGLLTNCVSRIIIHIENSLHK